MKNKFIIPVTLLIITLFVSCAVGETLNNNNGEEENNNPIKSKNIMPEDFEYLGAFLTPEPDPWVDDAHTWEWGGQAMTFDPKVRGDRCSDSWSFEETPRNLLLKFHVSLAWTSNPSPMPPPIGFLKVQNT